MNTVTRYSPTHECRTAVISTVATPINTHVWWYQHPSDRDTLSHLELYLEDGVQSAAAEKHISQSVVSVYQFVRNIYSRNHHPRGPLLVMTCFGDMSGWIYLNPSNASSLNYYPKRLDLASDGSTPAVRTPATCLIAATPRRCEDLACHTDSMSARSAVRILQLCPVVPRACAMKRRN